MWTPTPDDKGRLFDCYDLAIKRRADGEVRRVKANMIWHSSSLFWWTEGNGACDCNRASMFLDDLDIDVPCGHGGYDVVEFLFPDGTKLVPDGDC